MASPQVQAAWRESYRAKTERRPIPDEARRILNEYRRPGAREYQRKKRRAYAHIPAALFQALKDRGISGILINQNSRKLKPQKRYLLVGRVYEDCHQSLKVIHSDDWATIINRLSLAPFPGIVIDTKEIH